jgi:transposase-like protein
MNEQKKSRPGFCAEQKLAVIHMRELLEPGTTISSLCQRIGITPKTYYEWEKAFRTHGVDGLKPVARQPYSARTTRPETIDRILGLARLFPYWSSSRLHREMQQQGIKITRHAFERVLSEHGLANRELRIGKVEQAILAEELQPDSDQMKELFKANPCLADWQRMGHDPRYPMGIEALPVGGKSPALKGHYLVLAVDYDSLYVRGILVKARQFFTVADFMHESLYRARRRNGSKADLLIFGIVPALIVREEASLEIIVAQKSAKYQRRRKLGPLAATPRLIAKKAKTEVVPAIKVAASLEEARAVLKQWLEWHNNQPGPALYPTFGRKPADLLSVHTRRLVMNTAR